MKNHLHPLQGENCDSNSRLVVDEDDNIKSGLKGLRKRPRREVKIYIFNVYSFHHHRRFWPTSIRYLPVNRAARVSTGLPTQFLFNGGPESQPIAGSMPDNCVRRWLNTTPTLTERMIVLRQRLQQLLDG